MVSSYAAWSGNAGGGKLVSATVGLVDLSVHLGGVGDAIRRANAAFRALVADCNDKHQPVCLTSLPVKCFFVSMQVFDADIDILSGRIGFLGCVKR